MSDPLSDKQILSITESTSRINIWEGSVRSGKTYASILRFAKALREGPSGNAMVIGVSRDSIQRNFIYEFCDFLGFPYPTPKATQAQWFGRTIFFVGANDERAQRRIQGSTLVYAYVDEATIIPKGFFKMLLSRLSRPKAQLFCTTNPDSPFHWFKTDVLDNSDIDKKVYKFTLEDNPALTKEYIDNLKKEYTGLWYQRYIDGDWCLAEGLIYESFDSEYDIIDHIPTAQKYVVGIDYGTSNPTAFVLLGSSSLSFPGMWIEKEYYYDSKKSLRQKTDTEYAEDLIEFMAGKPIDRIVVDPSAASFKAELARQGIFRISDADNDVLSGIRTVSNLFSNGTLKIHKNCHNLIKEIFSYRWDEKPETGKDSPKKEFDHACDAMRYACMCVLKNIRHDDDCDISTMNNTLRARL